MVFDNNPHAVINMPQTNIFNNFTPRMKDLCKVLGCVDPKYYGDEKLQMDILFNKD